MINTYENATAVVMDLAAFDYNPFKTQSALQKYRNKTLRDTKPKNQIERWVLHTAGPRAGLLDTELLSTRNTVTDFPNINKAWASQHYCFYYATEWFHSGTAGMSGDYASMAVVRQNVCTGERTYFARPGAYLSEPTFVPRNGTAASLAASAALLENDGLVMFTLLNGTTGRSSLVLVDALTMEAESETELPGGSIGFTTHGQWYEDLLP